MYTRPKLTCLNEKSINKNKNIKNQDILNKNKKRRFSLSCASCYAFV